MSWWESIILGTVQGLGEFLPISSSGHLILMREALPIGRGNFLLFDILLHVATLLAVVLVFYKDIIKLFRRPFKNLGFLVIASLPAVAAGLAIGLTDGADFLFNAAAYLWVFFLVTAILLFTAELVEKRQTPRKFFIAAGISIKNAFSSVKNRKAIKAERRKKQEEAKLALTEASSDTPKDVENAIEKKDNGTFLEGLKMKQVVTMGFMQAFAVFPGLSRSGSTIFGGVVTRGKRETIAKFSFLMSIPIILGAAVVGGIVDIARGDSLASSPIAPLSYVLGMLAAFVVGFIAIKFMLKLIAKADFKWFSLYLLIISIVCFFLFFLPQVR